LETEIKENAIKQEQERVQELIRSAMRAVRAIQSLDGAEASGKFQVTRRQHDISNYSRQPMFCRQWCKQCWWKEVLPSFTKQCWAKKERAMFSHRLSPPLNAQTLAIKHKNASARLDSPHKKSTVIFDFYCVFL
jgi:Asp-tRNA(Asn)/Glu-tRNA(Gln) amidotransferase B subunit